MSGYHRSDNRSRRQRRSSDTGHRIRQLSVRPGVMLVSLLCGLLLLISSVRVIAQSMELIAAELPPYSYQTSDGAAGLGVEILQEAGRRLGHSGDIRLMPFKRAFQNALTRDNLLMTPVARVYRREGLLKWAIHYLDDSFFYVTRAGSPRLTHERARRGGTIAVLAGSAPLAQLRAAGISDYLEQTRDTANINMLTVGRVDGWFTSAILLSAAFKSSPELDPADFVIGEVQSRHCVYAVASLDTAESVIRPWRQAVESMRADGTLQQIINRYLDEELQRKLDSAAHPSEKCAYP